MRVFAIKDEELTGISTYFDSEKIFLLSWKLIERNLICILQNQIDFTARFIGIPF